jgi:Tfp pilus assembly ATPase PilU
MGMISMDNSLRQLVEQDVITTDAALEKALDKDEMRTWLKEHGAEVPDEAEGGH